MLGTQRARLAGIKRFDQLIAFLRDELDWPISTDDFDELTFDYSADELGIEAKSAAKIESIKRLRPLSARQPWGIYFVKFEPKRLPVVALRRILGQVALKKRASANSAERAVWAADDLLFISNYGEGDERQISFAHFSPAQDGRELPTLKVLGWNNLDTELHLDAVAGELSEQLAWPADEADLHAWRKRWRSAFTVRHGEVITTSRDLALRLAELARAIRDRIKTTLAIETESGPLSQLMKAFRETLVHDLNADGFADMYAQTIAYGLLSARIADPKSKTADDFAAHMRTNPFLRELMQTFLQIGGRRGTAGGPGIDFDELGVSEVVELLDDAKMEAVVRDFGDRNPQEDPVIHFYELFLKEYDAKKRMQRGVFYTPRPVVAYIVRSVDELLREEFGLEDGLADTTTWGEMAQRHRDLNVPAGVSPHQDFVQILDPATGTGTFLVEVIDVIHNTLVSKWTAQGHGEKQILALWNEYVPTHLLPRLHAYELLMAPYAIAHLKVGLKLYATGYRFGSAERARIYLTNALEPASDIQLTFDLLPALAHEAQAVNEVKRNRPFTVVVGNPPYSIVSANAGPWIVRLSEAYKTTVRSKERQIQALSDDYVKFLRLAQWHVERAGSGILGLITNNGYLDGHLFVDMRASLRSTCPSLRVVNLHGNLRTRERTPTGGLDENVFDIQTGVAIALAARPPSSGQSSLIYADLWGSRQHKYGQLVSLQDASTSWQVLSPHDLSAPWLPMAYDLADEWNTMLPLPDVFGTGDRRRDAQVRYAAGFVSQQDDFAIAFTKAEIRERVAKLLSVGMTEDQLRREYRLCTTNQWSFDRARRELRAVDLEALITPCTYRPFDQRYTVFHRGVVSILRMELMRHMVGRGNVALLATRGISRQGFAHAFVASGPIDRHALDSASESMFVFPLWMYPTSGVHVTASGGFSSRVSNLSPTFVGRLSSITGPPELQRPEAAFEYVYAVLHSSAYRARYLELLRRDFPRIPIPRSARLWRALSRHGAALVALHLMLPGRRHGRVASYDGPRRPVVKTVSWAEDTVWLDSPRATAARPVLAGTAGFRGVPEGVWNLHVGGYQVCRKWLSDRRGRALSDDEISHYLAVVDALEETIRVTAEIDTVIEQHGGWPRAFAPAADDISAVPMAAESRAPYGSVEGG